MALQEDDVDGMHFVETLSWIAISSAAGKLGGLRYESAQLDGVTHTSTRVQYAAPFASTPVMFGAITSMHGCCSDAGVRCDGDPATLRSAATDSDTAVGLEGGNIWIDESACNLRDDRDWTRGVRKGMESISWLAIEEGDIHKSAILGCDGVVGSGVTYDMCGACGGNGTACRCWEHLPFEWFDLREHPEAVHHGSMQDDSSVCGHATALCIAYLHLPKKGLAVRA